MTPSFMSLSCPVHFFLFYNILCSLFPPDDTAGSLMCFCEQEKKGGGWCLHIRQPASRIYAFPGRRPWAIHIYTHTVHPEEKLNAASTREGQTTLWILIESGWLSAGSAVGLQYSVFQTVWMCLTHLMTKTVWSSSAPPMLVALHCCQPDT